MRLVSPLQTARRQRGVALVIVLSFVVLLTGVVLAFFSRAISERQISNGSAGEVRADLFAQGAADSIIGDLRQEIAAGSKMATPAPDVTVYAPKAPATAVPALVPLVGATPKPGLENLVKTSARNQPFFPSNANYDTTNYPPPGNISKPVGQRSRAANVYSDAPSLNGRYVSADRWNKGLLMAKNVPGSESVTPTTNFVSPDWVLVARDGSNPIAWNANMATSNSTATSVVGRYAYNIYDEGGLLDVNVAGYPTSLNAAQAAYKKVLSFADLRELRDAGGTALFTNMQVDALVGWRNYASGLASGTFPNLTSSATDYAKFVTSDPRSFLTAGGTKLNGGQSDRMFAGRQELMKILLQGIATGSADRIQLQNALQYLGTFSRGLEQPSVVKAQSLDDGKGADPGNALGYDNTVPKLLPATSGGNNGEGLDAAINPSFLTVRVKTTTKANPSASPPTGRLDGSDLVVGEPLVKKRFALNRLAWLTFAGPIASDSGQLNPTGNTRIATIITALENTYGFTEAFLKQGTAANIKAAFGLTWDSDPTYNASTDGSAQRRCWLYNVHNRNGVNGAIRKLSYSGDAGLDVLGANREADFFELLKAGVNVGSIGKPSTTPAGAINPIYTSQYNNDSRVDDQIIQMGANIIDQFDLDGYPTRIAFNDGGGARAFSGVENLPYLSRVVPALVKVKQAEPGTGKNIQNTGVGALLQCPELWNPHDYSTSNLDQTFGIGSTNNVAAPTQFRVYAQCLVGNAPTAYQMGGTNTKGNIYTVGTQQSHDMSPGWSSMYGFSWTSPLPHLLQASNTAMTFTVGKDTTGITRFREPTILYQRSQVDTVPVANDTNYDTIASASNKALFFTGDNGFKSAVVSGITGVPPQAGVGYIGFYIGATPLYWNWSTTNSTGDLPVWLGREYLITQSNQNLNLFEFHYYVQYQDPLNATNWIPYDEKVQSWQNYSGLQSMAGGGDPSTSANGWVSFLHASVIHDVANMHVDPRTGRFGHIRTSIPPNSSSAPILAWSFLPANPNTTPNGWLDATNGLVNPWRNGTSAGVAAQNITSSTNYFPTTMGWYPGGWGLGATTTTMLRPGLLEQNNPDAKSDGKPMDGAPSNISTSDANAVFYADADGVVRRAMGGLAPAAGTTLGLPMAEANGAKGITRDATQASSRPIILNRPFRTVGELAYTFSGTPWKSLNFSMPESGDSALLDVFSVGESDDAGGLVAGKVNLNTRQAPVLQAILAGAYKDEFNAGGTTIPGGAGSVAQKTAAALVARTASTDAGKGPLQNVSELVGRWVSKQTVTGGAIGPKSYDGFSADIWNGTASAAGLTAGADANILRFQSAAVRALAASGQTRVWNLLIDVIAQTGRYPQTAANANAPLAAFAVEGEQRYWVHVAIDRSTGQVLDKQIEVVKE